MTREPPSKDRESPSVRIPQQKRSEETRQRILDAGLRLFERDGYSSTSSKKIAREAGVSVGSFYSYFEDKKHLLMEIVSRKVTRLYELARKISTSPELRGADERALVRFMIHQARSMHIASPEFNREVNILCYTDDDVCRFMQQKNDRITSAIVDLLELRKDCLRVSDTMAAALIVQGAIEHFMHRLNCFPTPVEEERIVEALVDMVHTYLFKPDCQEHTGDLPAMP